MEVQRAEETCSHLHSRQNKNSNSGWLAPMSLCLTAMLHCLRTYRLASWELENSQKVISTQPPASDFLHG